MTTKVPSELIADNAVGITQLNVSDGSNGQVLTTNGSGTLSFSTVSGTTINNNANNRVITGSDTANTLEGEASFVFDGKNVGINRASVTQHATDVNTLAIESDKNGKAGAIQLFSANDTVSSVIHQDTTGLSFITNSSTSGTRNDIVFQTSSSEKMRITEAGHLGLGMTPAPVSSDTVLSIYNSATPRIKLHNSTTGSTSGDGGEINMSSSDLIIENREAGNQRFFTNGSERVRVDSSGLVGIGETSPTHHLHVNAGTTNVVAVFESSDAEATIRIKDSTGTAAIKCRNDFRFNTSESTELMRLNSSGNLLLGSSSANAAGGKFQLSGAKTFTAGIPLGIATIHDTTAQAAGVGGAINFTGKYLDNGTETSFASIEASKSDGTSGNYGSNLVFKTRENGGNQLERMRVNEHGTLMVGGTVNPTYAHRIYATGNAITDGTVRFDDHDVSVGLANVICQLSFQSDNDCTNGSFLYMTDGNGAIGSITAASGTSVSYNTTSDERLKKNIVDATSQLDTIKNIKIREFDWKKNDYHELGVIAQEIKTVVPNAVQEGGDDVTKHPFGVDYGKIVPYLIKAVQEQQEQIDALQSEIQQLKGE